MSGCTTFDQTAGFSAVSAEVEARSGKQVAWNLGTELDTQVAEKVRALLADKLTADVATQAALLNNRDLQALYAEVGVAQADLVQAGLLSNPIFDAAVTFPATGRSTMDNANWGVLHARHSTAMCRRRGSCLPTANGS